MDAKKKIRKHVPSSSSSDDDSSSSSSSSSDNGHHKKHRSSKKQRDTSSSSEGEFVRKSHKHQHKKSSIRKHSHASKVRVKMLQTSMKKNRSMSPESRAAHKHHLKLKLAKKAKQMEEHERHSTRRSRTPVRRDVKKDRTPEHRINSPTTRIRVSVPNNRALIRSAKDSPSTAARRYVRETIEERGIEMRQKEHEKMRRMQDEDHYGKYSSKINERTSRPMQSSSRMTPEKYRERSRSQSGRIPIRERLDKEYEYRRSDSREHDDYPPAPMIRGTVSREQMNRSYEYRSDERRIPAHSEYGQSSRGNYEERHHRWEDNRAGEPDTRGSRLYEGNTGGASKSWSEHPIHERKRIPDDIPYKERQWSENSGPQSHDKWSHKEKDPQEWKRGGWKDQQGPQSTPTMPHLRRWPGSTSDNWNSPRGPPPHKMDAHSPSGPFKPRANAPPYFGFKRFPYKRFPNQYSKINFPSKRVLPSAAITSQNSEKQDEQMKISEPMDNQQQQSDDTGVESGEITREAEEDKIAQPDTTFSGLADPPYQEECEGNLSEFSDVDDEILNREEIEENSSSQMDVQTQSQCTTSTASRAHNRIAYVNNRIFSPFSSDYYCIYGLLPRHADDDEGKCELARASAQENQQQSTTDDQQIQNDQITNEESTQDATAQKMISKIHANKELKKEMDLDFEEISDGELEQQESAIKGFGDALGVDWASLAKETQRPINRSSDDFYDSTKSHLTAHRILWDIGISVKFAGEEFAREKLWEVREKLRAEKNEWRFKKSQQLKDEKAAAGMNGDVKNEKIDGIKVEIEDVEEQDEDEFKNVQEDELEDFELDEDVLTHRLAQVQVLMRQLGIKRKNLILNSTGKYGRALSARKDLKLRRQLCNLPTKDLNIDRSCTSNSEINKHADEIYRKLIGEVN